MLFQYTRVHLVLCGVTSVEESVSVFVSFVTLCASADVKVPQFHTRWYVNCRRVHYLLSERKIITRLIAEL